MRKICSILFVYIFYFNVNINYNYAHSYENVLKYAKVKSNCILYKSSEMKDVYDDIYFLVPESYFVVILEEINQNCLKVQYDKFIGYVKTEFVIYANFTPSVKTLENIKVDIKENSGTQIWNKPTTSGSVLTIIPAGYKRLHYISMTYGDIPYGGKSNVWFYISFTPFENSTNVYEGYVYIENTTNLDQIFYNTEENAEIGNIENNANNSYFSINSTIKTIIIALITIPIILFFAIIMYKIVKKIKENTIKRNKYLNEVSEYKYNDFEHNSINKNNSFIKTKIDDMRNQIFIKKDKQFASKNNYPKFPIYDSDDDLL